MVYPKPQAVTSNSGATLNDSIVYKCVTCLLRAIHILNFEMNCTFFKPVSFPLCLFNRWVSIKAVIWTIISQMVLSGLLFYAGFWPGDPNEFGMLSYHSCGHLLGRPPTFGNEDEYRTVNAQAMLAGYAWLLGQANYQGLSRRSQLNII